MADRGSTVPDILKLAVQLIRRDLRYEKHIDIYRVSCKDLAHSLNNCDDMEFLAVLNHPKRIGP